MSLTLHFTWPAALWGLLLVPLALGVYVAIQRRRARYAARFSHRNLLPNLVPHSPGWRRHAPIALYLLALIGLLASLARPQAALAVPREDATVVLVMDTSYSMGAVDVQPTRLAAAEAAANHFLDTLPAPLRVSLVSFSNSPQVQTFPTTDRAAVRQSLSALRPDGGTAMGDAIRLAVGVAESTREPASDAGGTARTAGGTTPAAPNSAAPAPSTAPASAENTPPPAAILLLSDGANTAGQTQPLDAAAQAQRLGIPVYTIALGTTDGTIDNPENPGRGQRMAVPPDDATLQQVAQMTGGQFFRAPTAADLQAVYEHISSHVGYAQQEQEVTFAFVASGAALLAAGGALALLWFNRFP